MFDSKFFTVMIALTFIAMAAIVTFQVLEMCDYNLFATMFK